MPSPYELLQMINNQFNHEPSETIEEVNELISEIDENPKLFTYQLAKEVEEFSEKLGLCPLCGSKLIKLNSDYEPSEYSGRTVYEKQSKYGCESLSCGYIKQ